MTSFAVLLLLVTARCSSASQPMVVPLWPDGVPGSRQSPGYRQDTVSTESGALRVQHVISPTLSLYFPDKGTGARAAVVICPGGAYVRLAVDHEGEEVAKWLNRLGVVGIVLTYRLPSDSIMKERSIGPLQDVQEAIRIVRRRSGEWRIDPRRIGVMGFSAGGHLAGSASTLYGRKVYDVADTTSARPDFSLLIYGVLSMQPEMTHAGSRRQLLGEHPDPALVDLFSAERQVTQETPPAFLVHSANDRTAPVANSISYFNALNRFSIPAELHVYETGGHGYGLARNGGAESAWPEACRNWLKAHGIIR